MRLIVLRCIVCSALLAALPAVATAQEDATDIILGIGLVISPGYNDVFDDAYSDSSTSGGYGWLDLQFGVRIDTADRLSISPSVDLLVNFVSGSDSYANTIVLPSVSAQYAFEEGSSFFLRGEVNYGIPNMGGDRVDAESGGVGFGGALGYAFDIGIDVELGYVHVPVEINNVLDEDFGGVRIKVRGSF